ncbi:MAG: glutathione S-transferase N-terminal domain-containing protein [Myxococcota bacterium]
MRLYGTSRSHFTRVVRMCCVELSLSPEWTDVGNVGLATAFGGNPLMRVPVLAHDDLTLWETDTICRYLVSQAGRDPIGLHRLDWAHHNQLAVVRGIMDADVRLVLAERSGLHATGRVFDKVRQTIHGGLAWIESEVAAAGAAPRSLDYPTLWTIAMWDHLLLYGHVTQDVAPGLDQYLAAFAPHEAVSSTAPS